MKKKKWPIYRIKEYKSNTLITYTVEEKTWRFGSWNALQKYLGIVKRLGVASGTIIYDEDYEIIRFKTLEEAENHISILKPEIKIVKEVEP